MLEETKQQKQDLINKIQIMDFVIQTSGTMHTDYKDTVNAIVKRTSAHKVKLLEELLRLSNVSELEVPKEDAVIEEKK